MEEREQMHDSWNIYFKRYLLKLYIAEETLERWVALNTRVVDFSLLRNRSQMAQPGMYSDFSVGHR